MTSRYMWAFVAYNAYSVFLISVFQENTAFIFDAALIEVMKSSAIDPRDWGWGDHYIWRLFAATIVTGISGFLAGAVARRNGGIVAAVANIPSVVVWVGYIYLFAFSNAELEEQFAYTIISIVAIPLTSLVAYMTGVFGEEFQKDIFPEDTVLGIAPYHWIWAIWPIYFYMLGIVHAAARFFGIVLWSDTSMISNIQSVLSLISIGLYGLPLWLVYRVLRGEMLHDRTAFVRGVSNVGIILVGAVVAMAWQGALAWLAQR